MSIEKALADQTAAVNENTSVLRLVLAALQAGSAVGSTSTTGTQTSTSAGSTGKGSAADSDTGTTAEQIYWSVPNTDQFGTVESEAEFKKLKKTTPKAVKVPASKYQALVEAASQTNTEAGGETEYSDRINGLIESLPSDPEEADIVAMFQGYLSKDLSKDERTARAELIKPILEGVSAPKATAVKAEDRYDVMVAVIKAVETRLEETGQVSEDDDNGLV